MLQEFKGKVLPPNHPITKHVRRVTQRILEGSNLGTLDAPYVHRAKGTEDLCSFTERDELPTQVGEAKKQWHLFVVADDSVMNAMAAYGEHIRPGWVFGNGGGTGRLTWLGRGYRSVHRHSACCERRAWSGGHPGTW